MEKRKKIKDYNPFQIALIIFVVLVLVVPLIMPLPPLEGIKPVEELMYMDSQFLTLDNIDVHYIEAGEGEETFILLHGFGASTYSWRKIIPELSDYGKVIAYDRPAFGLTERITNVSAYTENPYSLEYQAKLLINLMDHKGIQSAVLVGNSAGGTVAIYTATQYPDRVSKLILVDPAVFAEGGMPGWVKFAFGLPQINRLGPVFVRSIQERGLELLKLAWYDEQKITDEDLENYQRPLKMENWDIGLWEYTKVNGNSNMEPYLSGLNLPVLVISGKEDRLIPVEDSIQASEQIPNASISILDSCGHVPQEECPQKFMAEVSKFIQ
jgi:pimeloyl-ACP methyl ester carboxylesterase